MPRNTRTTEDQALDVCVQVCEAADQLRVLALWAKTHQPKAYQALTAILADATELVEGIYDCQVDNAERADWVSPAAFVRAYAL